MITLETTTSSRAIIRHVIADDVMREPLTRYLNEAERQEMPEKRPETAREKYPSRVG